MKFWSLLLPMLLVGTRLCAAPRTQAGLTLLEPSSARAAAQAEAFVGTADDIGAFHYNPAALATLKSSQASFLYKQGLIDDTYGNFSVGQPRHWGGFGMSIGYYDAGTADVFDGSTQRTGTAQKDMTISLGLARQVRHFSLGLTGKYLASELGETAKASTFATDFGLAAQMNTRLRVGAALQNLGGRLQYANQGEEMPQIARAGISWLLDADKFSRTLVFDLPYYMGPAEVRPAVGLEMGFGPLALRAGYRLNKDVHDFSVGSGFMWGKSSLDYAFGLANQLDARHQVSFTTRFGGVPPLPAFVKKEGPQPAPAKEFVFEAPAYPVYEIKRLEGGIDRGNQVYIVQEGDTLRSIAVRKYGYEAYWDDIYRANQHVLLSPEGLKPGQKLLLPRKKS